MASSLEKLATTKAPNLSALATTKASSLSVLASTPAATQPKPSPSTFNFNPLQNVKNAYNALFNRDEYVKANNIPTNMEQAFDPTRLKPENMGTLQRGASSVVTGLGNAFEVPALQKAIKDKTGIDTYRYEPTTRAEKALSLVGNFGGEAIKWGTAYGTVGKLAGGAKVLGKLAPKARDIATLAVKGGASGLAVGAGEAALEGGDAGDIAKRAALYGGLGAVGDPLLEKAVIPLAKLGIKKVAPKLGMLKPKVEAPVPVAKAVPLKPRVNVTEVAREPAYYRFTNKDSPMSDWGHAMFANDKYRVENYGKKGYGYSGEKATPISQLKDDIKKAWDEDIANGFSGDFGNGLADDSVYYGLKGDDIYPQFNPSNIVDSAEAYDSDLVQWLYERVLEPRGIGAVSTKDGAIVFDESLIKKLSSVPETPKIPLAPKERQFAQTVKESQVAPGIIKENLDINKLTYEPITNVETFSKAEAVVKQDAVKAAELFNAPSKGVSADDVALGEALITKAIKDGNPVEANRLIADLAEKLTTAGQAVQAASIFKKLTPEGMLLYAQRTINAANKDLFERMGKKAQKIILTSEDSQFILDQMKKVQELPEGRQREIELAKVMQLIADKVPARLSDRLKGLQRITLLLNPKTMVRNTLGNVLFGTVDNAANVVGTPIDAMVSKFTGQRTTTLPSLKTQLKGGIRGVKETVEDARLGIDTYSGRTQYELPSKRVFFNDTLNKLDRATRVGLQLGDRPFYQAAYDDTLRQQMKLAKVSEATPEMIEQAHKIAQQRTYQDTNSLTEAFKKAQSALNLGRGFGLGNVVLPFTKTPANILKRAIEYSPVGLEKAFREATNISKGTFDQRAFVDSVSRSVTGTALIMVGYDLAKKGVLTGSGNKDKDVAAFERGLGKNDYAYKVGDKYYTYDWAQPASMALAMGADMYLKGKDRQAAENVVAEAIKSGGETLFKQSLLQGVQRFMGGYSPIDNLEATAINAPSQLVPTLSRQVAQLTDPVQRSTYSSGNLGSGVNVIKSKLPVLSKTLEPKIDTSGNVVKSYQGRNNLFNVMLNPGSYTEFKPNKVQAEILRLYEATGEKDIFPKLAPKSFTENGKKITLTPQEITAFQQLMGQKTEERMGRLTSPSLSDKTKVGLLKTAIDNSYEDAKRAILRNRKAGAINPR